MGKRAGVRRAGAGAVAVVLIGWAAPGPAGSDPAPPTTVRVNVGPNGVEATGGRSIAPAISRDGRFVAFQSAATNLVNGDDNNTEDVFVRDTLAGVTTRESVASDGSQAVGPPANLSLSGVPVISGDGRFVAFLSFATNLVPDDTNNVSDAFVRDRQTGTTTRVNLAPGGAQAADGGTFVPLAMTADARFVAFRSTATNLVTGDTNGQGDIFVHDREAATTSRVSVATGGGQATGSSSSPSISDDGRYVVFQSTASDLVPGDTNGFTDVFLHDRAANTTVRLSVAPNGEQGLIDSDTPVISGDGQFVAFRTGADNFVPGDDNGARDIVVLDRTTNRFERANVSGSGAEGVDPPAPTPGGGSSAPVISPDGRYVAFLSNAVNLVAGDTNLQQDAFVRDRWAGTTTRISVGDGGIQANATTVGPQALGLSADGRFVAFLSESDALVAGDRNGASDIFVRDLGARPTGRGYRLVAADGGVFAFGDAAFLGSTGGLALRRPIVGAARTPSGQGYWLAAADGGVFAFGDASFKGGTASILLRQPVTAIAAVPSGTGYWLASTDGGVFAFGAGFFGSAGAVRLNSPVVAIVASPSGAGYWLVAADGGVFAFGDARFLGSTGGRSLASPMVGMAATPSGRGYWLVAADGGVFAFGDAGFLGSTGAFPLRRPIVGFA